MRIAITGTHSVGKTTLVEQLRQALPEYDAGEEAYYEQEESGILFPEEPTVDDYLMLFDHSVRQIAQSGDNVIFDRSPVDMLAYIQATDELDNSEIQSLYRRAKDAMIGIDLLVYIPVETPDIFVCPDSDLPELRYEVGDILNDLVWDFDTQTIEVTGSPAARRDQVLSVMKQ